MKTLVLKDVRNVVISYCNIITKRKPIIFWFHSNSDLDQIKAEINANPAFATMQGHPFKQGHSKIIWEGEQVKLSEHPEILSQFVYPPTMTDKTRLFVYHRYKMQLDREQLDYCLDMVNVGNYPVICLMNNYAIKEEKPNEELLSLLDECYEQYDVIN